MSNVPGNITIQSDSRHYNGTSQPQQTTGQWRGEGVRVSGNDKSLFASAAEEMSFLRSEKKETDFSKRKVSDRSLQKTQAMEQALAYLEKTKELDKDKQLTPFLIQLLNQPDTNKVKIQQLVSQQFTDISQQYLALVFVREQLRRKARSSKAYNGDLLAQVDSVLDELMTSDGAAIQAGLNIVDVAVQYADAQIGSVNNLRKLYRDAVLDYGSLTDTYEKILTKYGEKSFSSSVAYLVSALGADLAAEGPSLPKERLRMIIEDLYKLQALESLDDECNDFLQQLERIYHAHTPPNKFELMGQLLSLLEKKWISIDKLESVSKTLNVPTGMAIYFWRGFKELIRTIPLKAYNDPYEREKLITVIQECLDLSIDNEAID